MNFSFKYLYIVKEKGDEKTNKNQLMNIDF